MIKDNEDLNRYFPDLENGQYPERSYLITVLGTLRDAELKEIVDDARNKRAVRNDDNQNNLIKIHAEIKEEIYQVMGQKCR